MLLVLVRQDQAGMFALRVGFDCGGEFSFCASHRAGQGSEHVRVRQVRTLRLVLQGSLAAGNNHQRHQPTDPGSSPTQPQLPPTCLMLPQTWLRTLPQPRPPHAGEIQPGRCPSSTQFARSSAPGHHHVRANGESHKLVDAHPQSLLHSG